MDRVIYINVNEHDANCTNILSVHHLLENFLHRRFGGERAMVTFKSSLIDGPSKLVLEMSDSLLIQWFNLNIAYQKY